MNLKAYLKRVTALWLSLGVCIAQVCAFSDTNGHWAQTAIDKWSNDYGLIRGYDDGTFRPDAYITRGAFAGILDRFLNFDEASPAGTFSDISGSYWEESILKLNAAGIYLGNNGKALPTDSITRQQAVSMIARAFAVRQTYDETPQYTDENLFAAYSDPYIHEMTARGWINDSTDGRFRPMEPITRAELVNILNNMIDVLISENVEYT